MAATKVTARIHIFDSDSPYEARASVVTRCRIEIEKPDFSFMWDEQAMGEPLSLPLGICRKCLKALDPKFRYSYGVKSACWKFVRRHRRFR